MLVKIAEAAQLVGLSAGTLRYRVLHARHIPLARRNPMRVRLGDVLAYRETMPALQQQGQGRPRLGANRLLQESS